MSKPFSFSKRSVFGASPKLCSRAHGIPKPDERRMGSPRHTRERAAGALLLVRARAQRASPYHRWLAITLFVSPMCACRCHRRRGCFVDDLDRREPIHFYRKGISRTSRGVVATRQKYRLASVAVRTGAHAAIDNTGRCFLSLPRPTLAGAVRVFFSFVVVLFLLSRLFFVLCLVGEKVS